MKIAIISYWDTTHNYGQVLQCYALQTFLKECGHNAFHLKFIEQPLSKIERFTRFLRQSLTGAFIPMIQRKVSYYLCRTNKVKAKDLEGLQKEDDTIHDRKFDSFRKKYITFSENVYNKSSIQKTPPEVDCLIAGSDQIWSIPNPVYMLDFGPKAVKRIAYAASLGGRQYSEKDLAKEFKKYLDEIDIVTCREQDGVDVCKRLGRNDAELVPDPVFLLPKENYEKIAILPEDRQYLFIYLLGNPIDVDVKDIFEWAKTQGVEVKYVSAQGRKDDYPKLYPNVDEFLGLILNAKYVITNSFHGMAMSIILNKQFQIIPLSGNFARMNSRVTTTLSNLNLNNRIYKGSLDEVMKNIEYSKINQKLSEQRQQINTKFEKWLS